MWQNGEVHCKHVAQAVIHVRCIIMAHDDMGKDHCQAYVPGHASRIVLLWWQSYRLQRTGGIKNTPIRIRGGVEADRFKKMATPPGPRAQRTTEY
jgi:hypothetical protein